MPESFTINLKNVVDVVKKEDEMTIREKNKLHNIFRMMQRQVVLCLKPNGVEKALTDEQKEFIHYILPKYISSGVPKLDEVCRLFDIDVETDSLYGYDTYVEFERCDCY